MSDTLAPVDVANLNALLGLINSSVQSIISIYNTRGHTVPTLESVEPGPFDSPEFAPLELTRAIQVVEGACAQLCATIAPPGHAVINKAHAFDGSACLRVATSAKISDYLLDKPAGLHATELGKLSGIDPGKLGRVLRHLATRHVYREVRPDVYANNRLSMKLVSHDPVSAAVGVATDESMKANAHIYDVLQDPELGTSYAPEKSPFAKVYDTTLFKFYIDHPDLEKRFSNAMIGWSDFTDRGMLPKIFPWSSLPLDTIVCDVGGGNGHVSLDLVTVHPHLKVVVQDLDSLRPKWQDLWDRSYQKVVDPGRAEFVPIDFFKESPVKDCDIYYIRHILHDWPDAECVKLLRNVKASMKPTSRILINEYVLQPTTRFDVATGPDLAPEPLLPNFGEGKIRRYNQDINMLGFFNAKERTLQEFLNIGEQAGLKYVTFWDSGDTALVEFVVPV